jgi:hypothetical protein
MSPNSTIQAALSLGREFALNSFECAFANDNSFGPSVAKTCRAFDFTLLFEQAFLSMVPSILLVLGSVFRLSRIARHDAKTSQSRWHTSKLVRMSLLLLFRRELRISDHRKLLCVYAISVASHGSSTIDTSHQSLTRSSSSLVHWGCVHVLVIPLRAHKVDPPFGTTQLLPLLLRFV